MCEPSSEPGRLSASRRKSAAVITQRVCHKNPANLLDYLQNAPSPAHFGAVDPAWLGRVVRDHLPGGAAAAPFERAVSRRKLGSDRTIGAHLRWPSCYWLDHWPVESSRRNGLG